MVKRAPKACGERRSEEPGEAALKMGRVGPELAGVHGKHLPANNSSRPSPTHHHDHPAERLGQSLLVLSEERALSGLEVGGLCGGGRKLVSGAEREHAPCVTTQRSSRRWMRSGREQR